MVLINGNSARETGGNGNGGNGLMATAPIGSSTDHLSHALPESSPSPKSARVSPMLLIVSCLLLLLLVAVLVFSFLWSSPSAPQPSPNLATPDPASLLSPIVEPPSLVSPPSVPDFVQRLDSFDTRLSKLEQSLTSTIERFTFVNAIASSDNLSTYTNRLDNIENFFASLQDSLTSNSDAIAALREAHTLLQSEAKLTDPTDIAADLKLLSVSIWDDGAVGLISLGPKNTTVAIGDFIVGLKVEELSTEHQTITLYQPTTNRRFTLYADSIVYKEEKR